jgi:hypothetical protein
MRNSLPRPGRGTFDRAQIAEYLLLVEGGRYCLIEHRSPGSGGVCGIRRGRPGTLMGTRASRDGIAD